MRVRQLLYGVVLAAFVGCGGGGSGNGGPPPDGGVIHPDAGTPDAGTPDAGTPDAGTPDAGTPDAGATGYYGTYQGTVTSTFQVIDVLHYVGATGSEQATHQVEIVVDEPQSQAGEETNPFFLNVVTPLSETSPLLPGTITVTSAPQRGLFQAWTYSLDDNGRFSGSSADVGLDSENQFVTLELGGALSSNQWAPCTGTIRAGSTLEGRFDENQLELTVRGQAGGYDVGLTCEVPFSFEVHITARRTGPP